MTAVKKPKPEVRTQIRIPAALHAKLVAASRKEWRSLNAEMVKRLQESFAKG